MATAYDTASPEARRPQFDGENAAIHHVRSRVATPDTSCDSIHRTYDLLERCTLFNVQPVFSQPHPHRSA
jgi:hypothetical protein